MEQKSVNLTYPGNRPGLDKQLLAHRLCGFFDERIEKPPKETFKTVGICGSFATGKTFWLVMNSILNAIISPNSIGFIGRLTMPELRSTILTVFNEICPPELIKAENKNEQWIKFYNDYLLYYMALDDAKGAINKIKSLNLGWAGVDQLEEISEDVFFALKGRLRNSKGLRQFNFTANPEGHNWIWKRWVKDWHKHKTEKMIEMSVWKPDAPVPTHEEVQIRAKELKKDPMDIIIDDFPEYQKYTDNPFLPMDYLIDMLSWPERIKNRYVFGSHEAYEGLIYDIFDEKIHVIEPFDTSKKDFIRVWAYDYGKRNPGCALALDVDGLGNIYVSEELYHPNLEVSQWKLMIRAKNKDKKVEGWVADPSIWSETIKGQASVGSRFLDKEDGSGWQINWQKGDNSAGAVQAGIDLVTSYLHQDMTTEGQPNLYFMRGRCPNTLEEIMDYRYKDYAESMTAAMRKARDPLEKPRKFNDHSMDALRYGIMFIKMNNIRPKTVQMNMRKIVQEILNRRNNQNIRPHMVA
jgi:PBSX family phage terminase large subunit